MKLLTRYLMHSVLFTSLFVLLALLGLFLFFDLIGQLNNLGKGHYSFIQMLVYVVLLAPRHAYEFMPIATLIGSLLALSTLNQYSEYTVMRAGGLSVQRILGILAMAGVVLAAVTLLIGEYVAPYTERYAQQLRLGAKEQLLSDDYRSGFWLRDSGNFINVREVLPDQTLRNVNIYEFDHQRRLTSHKIAERGEWRKSDESWTLYNITSYSYTADAVLTVRTAQMQWRSVLTLDTLAVLVIAPEQMSVWSLFNYIQHLKNNQQDTNRYQIALWGKLIYPLICLVMLVIALPFAQTQRRSGGVGMRLFIGVMLGLGFYFVNQLITHWGLLYGWPPLLTSVTAPILLLIGASWMLYRQEIR